MLFSEEWDNYVLSVIVTSMDNDFFGLLFGYQEESNYYRLEGGADAGKMWSLLKQVSGVWSVLGVLDRPYIPWKSHTIEVSAFKDKIRVYVNGQLLFDVTDHSLLRGKIGLECMGQEGMFFDDVEVRSITDGANRHND